MRRSELFALFSGLFAVVLFAVYRIPFIIYYGLFYSLVAFLEVEKVKPRPFRPDLQSFLGIVLVVVSPAFLVVRFGQYSSPSMFYGLLLLGIYLISFEAKSSYLLLSLSLLEVTIVLSTRTSLVSLFIDRTSRLFVDVTSYLVRGLIDITKLPIAMNGNVATVRRSIVVIGSGCSGLDAFVLYLFASLILIYLRKSNMRESALLLVGSLGIIPLNALRIFTLLAIGYHSGISFLELFHSHLGDLMFLAYVFLYWWWATGRKAF